MKACPGMKVYQLMATRVDGSKCDWDCNPIYATRARAEEQIEIEIKAYTSYNGEVLYDCPYIFEIKEIEVE